MERTIPFAATLSIFDKCKIIHSNRIVCIPNELKEQFERQQLKNSLYRIKNFSIIVLAFELLLLAIRLITTGQISKGSELVYIMEYGGQNSFYFLYLFMFLVYFLFIALANYYLHKNNNHTVAWSICYLLISFRFLSVNVNMWFSESSIHILYLFSGTIFLNMFIPDFKPRVFIWSSILFYIVTVCILEHKYSIPDANDFIMLISNTFIAIFIIKILHYNSNAKVFINMSRINILNEKLASLSITDELTRLNNRRSFLEYMDIIWKQSNRLKLPITVIMIDIDYFKKYNDSLGHLEGDKALIAVAQCLKSNLKRETDFVARFGGEEFVCLLPYIEKTEAVNFAQKLVQSIEDMKISHPMNAISEYVTISAGMSTITPAEHNTHAQLLDEADKALYRAKQSGRNKVIAH